MAREPSPTLLAIDAAGERCSLALLHGAEMATEVGAVGLTHLEHVMPMIRGLFVRCALRPQDCDAFAFASGPGSFTGLRVACTIVQGLALGTERPVIAIGHLDALLRAGLEAGAAGIGAGSAPVVARPAARSFDAGSAPARVLVLLDARMQQGYWAVYEDRDGAWQILAPAAVSGRDELLSRIKPWRPGLCIGDAGWIHRYIGVMEMPVQHAAIDAAIVARLAQERLARGEVLAPERAFPLYVRDRVAQTVAQRQQARLGRA